MPTRKHSYDPNYAIPPGATIAAELDFIAVSRAEAAGRLGVSEEHLARMIRGDVAIDPEMAQRLEVLLEIPVRFWVSAQAYYDELKSKLEREASCSS